MHFPSEMNCQCKHSLSHCTLQWLKQSLFQKCFGRKGACWKIYCLYFLTFGHCHLDKITANPLNSTMFVGKCLVEWFAGTAAASKAKKKCWSKEEGERERAGWGHQLSTRPERWSSDGCVGMELCYHLYVEHMHSNCNMTVWYMQHLLQWKQVLSQEFYKWEYLLYAVSSHQFVRTCG